MYKGSGVILHLPSGGDTFLLLFHAGLCYSLSLSVTIPTTFDVKLRLV